MKLGIVTYNIAKDWSIETIIENLSEVRFAGVELRTEHAHGVEISLSPSRRAEVRNRFAGSPIKIVALKPQLQQVVQRETVQKVVSDLRAKAKVE